MPIYEYTCKDCNNMFEEIVLSQDEIPSCPKCDSNNTTKLISTSRHQSSGSAASQSFVPQGGKSSCGGCSGGSCSTCG